MSFRIFRNWFCVFIALFFLPLKTPAFASTWVTGAMFDNNFSVTVEPQQSIKATINVSTWFDNSDSNDTANWSSTQYTFSGQNSVCVDTANFLSSDFHQNIFDFLSPSDEGTYNITLKAFSNENCTGGAITKSLTLTDIITVKRQITPTITPTPKPESSNNTDSNNDNSNSNNQTSDTNQSIGNFSPLTNNRFSLPTPTTIFQLPKTDIDENISTSSGQILGTTDIHDGCWLPILFIIALVINFFFVRYATKFTTLIPFIISTLSFSVDYLMLKKYGCDITWLSNFFWVGEIFSWLIPEFLKRKLFQK